MNEERNATMDRLIKERDMLLDGLYGCYRWMMRRTEPGEIVQEILEAGKAIFAVTGIEPTVWKTMILRSGDDLLGDTEVLKGILQESRKLYDASCEKLKNRTIEIEDIRVMVVFGKGVKVSATVPVKEQLNAK